jgi:glycosyltransferase involved in cell wall biosynthesis
MIRLGFVLPHLRPGGAERCVVNWLRALDRARFTPFLFLKRVEGAFLDLLPADVTPVPLGGARAALLPAAIGRALAEHGIDVAYSATNAVNLALMAARTSARRIVSEHTSPEGYLAEAKLRALRRLAMRRYYPRADAVAVPTEAIGSELRRALAVPLTTEVIANPVVESASAANAGAQSRAASFLDPGVRRGVARFRILAAGRLVPAKGFDTLIEALAMLGDLVFEAHIHGDGPLDAELRARIAAGGLAGRVHLHGYADLAAAMAEADLFVLSSRREGFGNVVVEAMAAGLPVLATRTPGPAALIDDGVTGWLVPPENPHALAVAIARLARDPDRGRVVAPARAVAMRYTVAASTAALEALVGRVASGPAKAA